jgi:hypothetical protein
MLKTCQSDVTKCMNESQKMLQEHMKMDNCAAQPTKPNCVRMEAYRKAMWEITASGRVDDVAPELLIVGGAIFGMTKAGTAMLGTVGAGALEGAAVNVGVAWYRDQEASTNTIIAGAVSGGVMGPFASQMGIPSLWSGLKGVFPNKVLNWGGMTSSNFGNTILFGSNFGRSYILDNGIEWSLDSIKQSRDINKIQK